jgi:hypothetical protein
MKSIYLILLVALSLPACARFSETARQQRAYEKYVRKSMANRNRQMAHIPHNPNPEVPPLDTGKWQATMSTEGAQPAETGQADQ